MKTFSLIIFTLFIIVSCKESSSESDALENESLIETAIDSIVQKDTLIEKEVINDWTKENLNGKIKSTSIHTSQVDENGEEYGMGGSYEGYDFNEKGQIIMMTAGGCCGAYEEEIEYKYNDQGQLTHRILRKAEPGEDIDNAHFEWKEKYFYNEEGLLLKKKVAGEDQELDREHIYKFDAAGLLLSEDVKSVNEKDSEFIVYMYGVNQKTVSYKSEDGEYKRAYIEDDDGQLIQEELHLKNGSIQETKYTNTFDEFGNWVTRESVYRYVYADGKKDEWKNSLREIRTIVYY